MTDPITKQILQKIYHLIRRGQRNGHQFDIESKDIVAWLILNNHVDDVLQRNGISGLTRIDATEPMSQTNIQFDVSKIAKKTPKPTQAEPKEIPKNYKVLTKSQWIAELIGNEANA